MTLVCDRRNAQVSGNKNEDDCPFRARPSRERAGEFEYANCSGFLDCIYAVGMTNDENGLARDLALNNCPHRVRADALQRGIQDKSRLCTPPGVIDKMLAILVSNPYGRNVLVWQIEPNILIGSLRARQPFPDRDDSQGSCKSGQSKFGTKGVSRQNGVPIVVRKARGIRRKLTSPVKQEIDWNGRMRDFNDSDLSATAEPPIRISDKVKWRGNSRGTSAA
jgi:hypothetical protein